MLYIKYLLLITCCFYSTAVFSCGALNGKGLECNLDSQNYDIQNILIDNKIFFYFKNEEVYQVYLYTNSSKVKLNEINLGLYDLSSDTMQWNNNEYVLIRKNFELKIALKNDYTYSCILLGRPIYDIKKYFREKLK